MTTTTRVPTAKQVKARQSKILADILAGDCTVNCAGAVHTDSVCKCRCGTANHGALWFDEIVASTDRGADA